jgi:hypothetical protein
MSKKQGGPDGGSVTLLRPDGTVYPGSPFTGGGLPGPWAVVVDGNDNVWISNFAAPRGESRPRAHARATKYDQDGEIGDEENLFAIWHNRIVSFCLLLCISP